MYHFAIRQAGSDCHLRPILRQRQLKDLAGRSCALVMRPSHFRMRNLELLTVW